MTERVSSMVVQETVSQILSGLVHSYMGKGDSNPNDNLERLEMAISSWRLLLRHAASGTSLICRCCVGARS
jgi:hypothetical protein